MKLLITFLFSFLVLQAPQAQSQDPDQVQQLLQGLANKCKALQPGSTVMDAPCRSPYTQVPGAPIVSIGEKEMTCCMLRDDSTGGGGTQTGDQISQRECKAKGGYPVGDQRRCIKPNSIIGVIPGPPKMYCCVRSRDDGGKGR